MSSPSSPTSPTTSTRRVNAVLPKGSAQTIRLLLKLAAKNGSIDAEAALALTNLLSDREFALEFKAELAILLFQEKARRATAKEAKVQKEADKLGVTIEAHKAGLVKD